MRTSSLITLSLILAVAITVFSGVPAFARDKNVPGARPNHLVEEKAGAQNSVRGLTRAQERAAEPANKGIQRAMERAARQGITPPAREKDVSPRIPCN